MINLGSGPITLDMLLQTKITWQATGDAIFPLQATILGKELRLRINDFPAEPLYTLFVDGAELESLEDWPRLWERPAPRRI